LEYEASYQLEQFHSCFSTVQKTINLTPLDNERI
jgi:hypothetical protein